jgi:gliding motility-associated lipoprotein GldH
MILFLGCDSSRLFEENSDFENKVWTSGDIRSFTFDIDDPDLGYNVYFNVRNTKNYPHYNLYISYLLKDSLNRIITEELKNVNLFDPKTGKPEGHSSLGNIFDHQFLLMENYNFESTGTKKIQLQQYMRYDSLPEIVSAGIRIEVVEPKSN